MKRIHGGKYDGRNVGELLVTAHWGVLVLCPVVSLLVFGFVCRHKVSSSCRKLYDCESAITSWQSDKDDVIQRLTLRHRGNQQAVLSCLEEKLEDPPLTQHLYGVQRTVQDRAGPPNQFAESQQTAAWRSLMPTQRSGVSSADGGDCDLLVQGVRVIKSSLVFFHHLITARMINFCMLRLTCLCLDLWEL